MGRVAAQSKMRRCGIKQRIKWLTIFLWVFATLKLIFTESCDLSYEMELLKMRMHKNCLLNHYSIEAASSIPSRQRELLSSRPSLSIPAFAGMTARDDDRTKHKHGFSLVELSIVLVILGLLVGGVLTGKSLIRAAELRSITTDRERFVAVVQIFNEKYQALPGDMTNATDFWGTAAACSGTHLQPSTDATTCNGDGNGKINVSSASNETYRFWQHLANAGLIEGQYSGVTGGGANGYTSIPENSPTGKISNQLWFVWNWMAPVSGGGWFHGEYGNRLSTGFKQVDGEPGDGFTTHEVWNIDKKLDDGKPGKGFMKVHTICTNATSGSDFESDYLLTSSVTCRILFPNAF
jgi:prepilin-type N-terminal cleavage/methylation domain-containing protein